MDIGNVMSSRYLAVGFFLTRISVESYAEIYLAAKNIFISHQVGDLIAFLFPLPGGVPPPIFAETTSSNIPAIFCTNRA